MERLLVVVFDNETKAYEGMVALRELHREGSIDVLAQAVVAKQPDGTATVKQDEDPGPAGALMGTSVGAIIGLLGGPAGVAIGSVSGLAIGSLFDLDGARVGSDFIAEVMQSVTPNKVAVIAEIDEEWTAPVDTRMEALGGTVLRRALWEVREKLRSEQLAAMKAELEQLKQEAAKAQADRRAKLQARSTQLQARIEAEQKKAEERWKAFQARRAAKRDVFKDNAVAAGRAIRALAKSPPL